MKRTSLVGIGGLHGEDTGSGYVLYGVCSSSSYRHILHLSLSANILPFLQLPRRRTELTSSNTLGLVMFSSRYTSQTRKMGHKRYCGSSRMSWQSLECETKWSPRKAQGDSGA